MALGLFELYFLNVGLRCEGAEVTQLLSYCCNVLDGLARWCLGYERVCLALSA